MKILKVVSTILLMVLFLLTGLDVFAGTLSKEYLSPIVSYKANRGAWEAFGDVSRMRVDGKLAYCIEPETPAHDGGGYESTPSYNPKMNLITSIAGDLGAESNNVIYTAAQKMLHGELGWNWYSLSGMSMTDVDNQINVINQKIKEWETKPSFDGQTVTVKYGESVTLTDTNNVLGNYSSLASNTAKVECNVKGNKLTITPKDSKIENGILTFLKPRKYGTPLVWKKANSQTILTQGDPTTKASYINLKIILMGKSQIKKIDAETGKPMAGVKFKMTVDGKDYDVTTNDKGIGFIDKEFLQDTEVTYKEVKTLDGYVLNDTPIKGKIKAGETITLSMNNETQKGRVKGHKDKEVYNAEKSDEQGKSVYDKVPLPDVTFDVVAQNDITRPSGEVVLKKGAIADTFTTDENGDFKSTKDFYIGAQNQYKLVERDVPKNYHPLYDEQATFSIPYDSENKTKVFTLDMGTLDNDLKTGTFDLEKIDSDTGKIIPNTQFLLRGLSAYNKDVLYTITTGDKATIDKLIEGKYELVEVKYADGHTANAGETLTKVIEIKDGQKTKVEIKNDTIIVKAPKVSIISKAHVKNGSQSFIEGDKLVMYDNVSITYEHVKDGSKRSFESILVARTPDGKETDIWKSKNINFIVKDSKYSQTVETKEIDTKEYPKGTVFYFRAVAYDENGYIEGKHNNDGNDEAQRLTGKPKQTLPETGEKKAILIAVLGVLILVVVAFIKRKVIISAFTDIKQKIKK